MDNNIQLEEWVKGNPIHNGQRGAPDSECCPDFSCCQPHLLAPVEVRELFASAQRSGNEKLRMRMLGEFLGKGIAAHTDKKVHIAGLEADRQELE